jgi:PAS domain S-box-containing protein
MLSENAQIQFDLIQHRLSEIQKRDQLLFERLADLEDFLENASVPLHKVDSEGIIIWANRYELDFIGYSRNEYVGRNISEFHLDKKIVDDILLRFTKNERVLNYPAKLKCANGQVKNVLINSHAFSRNGEFAHARCFTRDITSDQ